jgi:hypothetical protein
MLRLSRVSGVLTLAVVAQTAALAAQDEAGLRRALEGKRITVKIEMPASQEGVDVFPGSERPIDFPKLSGRLKKYGTALKDGESAMITKVKVKDDLIEIQIGGGGYGTSGDVLGNILTNKDADRGSAQQIKIANQRAIRAAAGSRFNLHYEHGVKSADATVDAVLQALADYASVAGVVAGSPARPAAAIHKGMSIEDVEQLAGQPFGTKSDGPVTTNKYHWQDGVLEADFVNGVLVGYRIASQ